MLRTRLALVLVGFALFSLTLTAQHAPVTAPTVASESIPNLGPLLDRVNALKTELRQYHDCAGAAGCYAKDLDQQADRAIKFLRLRVAHRKANDKLAVILDIDETALSNWAEMSAANFEYNSKDFNAWVASAQAPAIPGTLRIFKAAEELGVSVIFITGRPETQRASSEANLRLRGFDRWERLIMRRPDQQKLTAEQYKSAARGIVATKFHIVLNVGDQWSDLRGVNPAEFSVKYPDPYYFIK
ncbi:HAD family acid phosphatase [Telmatobacter sp. DSM 110680]|uniref:HAD family acid phosphatase n=1 Tax=Telmatobacter sp. DSM 110680 TaxID=3036704 RepID=A0AAU7DDQ9_9BACT